jgi:hypothetical protein
MATRSLPWFSLSTIGALIFASSLYPSNLYSATAIDNALYVEVNAPFFNQLEREVRQRSLQDISQQKIPDERGVSDSGIKYEVNGNYFSSKFRDIAVITGENRLELEVGIGDVHLHVSELKGKKKFLKTVCRNIDLYIASQTTLTSRAIFVPQMVDGQMQFRVASVAFTIPESNFTVVGPSSCSGILGGIFKRKLKKFLLRQRVKVEERVRERILAAAQQVGQRIGEKFKTVKEFRLGILGSTIDPTAVAKISLANLILNDQGMAMQFSAEFESDLPKGVRSDLAPLLRSGVKRENQWGFIGINPNLINTLIGLAVPSQGEFRQVTGRGNLDMDAFFDADAFSELIPDLINLPGYNRSLQAHYRLLAPPRLWMDESRLKLDLPTVELLLMVWHEDEWQPYYHFFLDITPQIEFVDSGDQIKVMMTTLNDVVVHGGWELGFPLGRPEVNHQLLADIFKELLTMDDSLPVLATFDQPKVEFDGVSLRSETVLAPPFFGLTLFE